MVCNTGYYKFWIIMYACDVYDKDVQNTYMNQFNTTVEFLNHLEVK